MTGAYYDDIAEQVEDILYRSQEYPFTINVDPLMNAWKKAKSKFIQMFGDNTIYRSKDKIRVKLTEKEKELRFSNFIEEFRLKYPELYEFVKNNYEGFYSNIVTNPCPERHIPAGMKLVKSFKNFISEQQALRMVQDIASKYIQEDKIEGYLYLSVDPRDFLTLSENGNNWTSCHSLDGTSRAGNLNYMVDETTIIAYLADEKKEYFLCLPEDIKWFSKRWRMLIHTDCQNLIIYNKQYPFTMTNQDLLKLTHDIMRELIGSAIDFSDLKYDTDSLVDQMIDVSEYNGYSDLFGLTNYTFTYSTSPSFNKENLPIQIGKSAPCLVCGDLIPRGYANGGTFLCTRCIAEKDADGDFYLQCNECGKHIYPEEIYHVLEDHEICCDKCFKEFQRLKGE